MSYNPPPHDPYSDASNKFEEFAVTPPTAPPPSELPPFSFTAGFRVGFESFKKQYPMLLAVVGILIGIGLVNWIFQQIVGLLFSLAFSQADPRIAPALVALISIPVQFFVLIPLNTGGMFAGIRAARGQRVNLADFVLAFKRYGTFLLTMILTSLAMLAAGIPLIISLVIGIATTQSSGGGGAAPALIMGVGAVISAVLMTVVSVRLYFAAYIAIDPALPSRGASDCVLDSWRMIRPRDGSFFGFLFCSTLLCIATILALCLGVIFIGGPLLICLIGAAYAMMSRELMFHHRCTNCGFDMSGLFTTICPECEHDNSRDMEMPDPGAQPL